MQGHLESSLLLRLGVSAKITNNFTQPLCYLSGIHETSLRIFAYANIRIDHYSGLFKTHLHEKRTTSRMLYLMICLIFFFEALVFILALLRS